MLTLKDVNCFFGKSHILHSTSLEIGKGSWWVWWAETG